ncbi:hypothetical protein [Coraliomargarita parva]|uniref:hypothetical protein n=1 Tax=Coraliomargarita parva TaxID=3014050 RepID=UPI0022B54009|nr:hypothetical protein [Coraliomargarita parva]
MKKYIPLFCLTGLCAGQLLTAQTQFNIDFNTAGDFGSNNDSGWNVYAAPVDVDGSTLITSTDAASSITLSQSGVIADSTAGNLSVGASRPSWVVSDAGNDFFFTDTSGVNESFTLTFGGMTAGNNISLDIYACRTSTAAVDGTYEYSLDGGSTWFGFDVLTNAGSLETADGWDGVDTKSQTFDISSDGYDNGRYMNISDVTLTGSTLLIRVTEANVSGAYVGVNAMRLTVIPESSTYASILGLAGICSAVFLKRKRR